MLNRVLVATEASETAQWAEALGGEIARRCGATLLLAHVAIEEPSQAGLDGSGRHGMGECRGTGAGPRLTIQGAAG